MRKLFLFCLIVVFAVACGKVKDGEYKVEIYATNDVHAQFFDFDYSGKEKPYSLSKVSKFINDRRAEIGEGNLVLLELGDMLQGDAAAPFFRYNPKVMDTTYDGDHYLTNVMEFMKYDAAVVGNHDIEAGHPAYDRISAELDFPYLAANAFDQESGKPYFTEYTVIEKAGLKIAVIGLITHWIDHWLDREFYQGITFKNPVPVADSLVSVIQKREKPDLIGIAIHSGTGKADDPDSENLGKYLAINTPDIDFLFCAHDHSPLAESFENVKSGKMVPLVNSGSHTRNVSKLAISLTYKNGELVSKSLEPSLVSMKDRESDEAYNQYVAPYYNKVKDFAKRVVGEIEKPLDFNKSLIGYSDYINFLNELQMKSTGADISFAAPLKTNLLLQPGKVDYELVMDIYPFENFLYVVALTGEQVKNYLEYNYDKWINTISSEKDMLLKLVKNENGKYRFENATFNFDAARGINYLVDVTKPFGQRVTITSDALGFPFDLNRRYRVAMTSYSANGGGDLLEKGAGVTKDMLDEITIDRYPSIREIVYSFFADGGKIEYDAPANWTFVPVPMTKRMLERDINLIRSFY